MKWSSGVVWVAVGVLLSGCASGRLLPYTEVVMTPGMRVTATNRTGRVTITAGAGTRRRYAGAGFDRVVALTPRTERWNGSLGLYDPADSFSPYGRLLVEEGRIHCASVAQAMRWIREREQRWRSVYTNEGLVFGFTTEPVPAAPGVPVHSVELWQVYVNGHRPARLPGADDRAIRVEGGGMPETSVPYAAVVGYPMQ